MEKLTNSQIYNSIRSELSPQSQSVLPVMDEIAMASDVLKALADYPTAKNEFISSLTNRVVKTMFFSKLWNDPLKVLKKGMLPVGKSIEQVFVEAGAGINFGSHYEEGGNETNDLIGKRVPEVNVDYITENYKKQYKISFSYQQLKGAFINKYGLNDLLSKTLEAQLTQAELEEYEAIKSLLEDADMAKIELDTTYAKDIAKAVRTLRRKMTFVTDKYNMANVGTHTLPSKMVIFTVPEVEAELDVELYAQAFNMDKAELISRIIVIDEFADPNTKMIIADEDYIQVWDTLNEGGDFINPQGLYINYFLNRWMIVGQCKFANAIAIKQKASI